MSVVEAVDCSAVAGAAQTLMLSALPGAGEMRWCSAQCWSSLSWVIFGAVPAAGEFGDVPAGAWAL